MPVAGELYIRRGIWTNNTTWTLKKTHKVSEKIIGFSAGVANVTK